MYIQDYQVDGVQPTTTGSDVISVNANQSFEVRALTIHNTDTSDPYYFTLHRVPSGGSPDGSNQVIYQQPIPAGKTVIVYPMLNHIVPGGGAIHVIAEADSVLTVHLSGKLKTEGV